MVDLCFIRLGDASNTKQIVHLSTYRSQIGHNMIHGLMASLILKYNNFFMEYLELIVVH